MPDDDPPILVCVRVVDLARPSVPSDQAVCGRCLEPVWKSRAGWYWVGPIRCIECALAEGDGRFEGSAAPWVRDDLATGFHIHRIGGRMLREGPRRLD